MNTLSDPGAPLWEVLQRDRFLPIPVVPPTPITLYTACQHPYACCYVVYIGRERDLQHRGDHPILTHGAVVVCNLCGEVWFASIAKDWLNSPDYVGHHNA